MNARIVKKASRFFWIPLLLVVILLSIACSSGGTTSSNSPSTTQPKATGTRSPVLVHLASGPITYVAMGASDAVGVGSNQPGAQGYVPLVATHLPRGSHLVNLGISGIRLHEALSKELPVALSTSPELVTVWLVANDFVGGVTYEAYMHDLNTLLAQLHTHTHAGLVIANLPDLTRLPAFSSLSFTQKEQMLVQIKRWNTGIATAAAHYDVSLADLFSHGSELTAHPEYISGDGFHPSPRGYMRLANIFWAAIEG